MKQRILLLLAALMLSFTVQAADTGKNKKPFVIPELANGKVLQASLQ